MSRLSLRPGRQVAYRHSADYPWSIATVQSVVKDTVWIKLNADVQGLISLNMTIPEDRACILGMDGPPPAQFLGPDEPVPF
jgi:hypothetical protein